MRYSYDGTPLQAGQQTFFLRGRLPEFSSGGFKYGVVIGVLYKDDDDNASKQYVEYRVKDLETSETYEHCRNLTIYGGKENGDEVVLHPMTKLLEGVAGTFSLDARAVDTDGDQVLLGFIGGDRNQPVILGVMAHENTAYGATKADGERRYSVFQGTSIERRPDGSVQVKRGETTLTLNADETFVLNHKSGSMLSFEDSGDVLVMPAAGKNLLLGDGAASEGASLGTLVKSYLDGHTHEAGTFAAPVGGGAVTGVSGVPTSSSPVPSAIVKVAL